MKIPFQQTEIQKYLSESREVYIVLCFLLTQVMTVGVGFVQTQPSCQMFYTWERPYCSRDIQLAFLFFFFLINLFIFGFVGSLLLRVGFLQLWRAGTTLRCCTRASHCGGLSHCGARALGARASVVVARRLQSTGSVAVAHRPICSVACGILPDQGSNPCPLHWQADSQPLHHQGSPSFLFNAFWYPQ